ncbi:MAG TPA: hypothetical protein PKE12_07805 [Kiritimatiellia bacterium]|nr:hypothetical protein [Kiritimatiellia bacterium]
MLTRAVRRFLCLLIAPVMFTGCVQVEQTLSLDAEGGGVLTVQYSMTLEKLAELEARAREEAGDDADAAIPSPLAYDEAQIREDFKEYEPMGVTLLEARTWEEGGSKHVRLKMKFTSFAGLGQTEFLSDRTLKLVRVDDAYEFSQMAPESAAVEDEMYDFMVGMMKGFRATLSIETPGDILDSNSDETDGRKASWRFDLAKDPDALKRAQQLNLRVRFSAEGLALAEFPEP